MARNSIRDIVEDFLASGDVAVKIDVSKYASLLSAYYCFYNCIRNKCIKGCHLHTHKESLYLIKD